MIICGGSAIPRLIDFAAFREIADEVGAMLMVDAAHFIGLVAGKAIPSPVPYADVVTFTTHKVLRGPRGGALVCKAEHAAKLDKAVFPMMQGGPLMHAIAAKAVNLAECATPEYQAYARQVIANARALTAGLAEAGMRAGHRRHRHPPGADRPAEHRGDRQGRRGPLRRGRHRAEQERHPERPGTAVDRLRDPGRHAVGHHPGHDRTADGPDRPAHRPRGGLGRRRASTGPSGPRSASWSRPTRPTRTAEPSRGGAERCIRPSNTRWSA